MNKDSKILIVGADDIIERALSAYFNKEGFSHVWSSSKMGLNCAIQPSVYEFFQNNRPEYVFLSSTRCGGIGANLASPADFIYHNLESQNNVVYSAWKFGVKKLLYYASSCIYPQYALQPMAEESILQGSVEETSEPYAVAKIAGVKLCQAFRRQYGLNAVVAVPATIYGPMPSEDFTKSHVIGALLAKFREAVVNKFSSVTVLGTGDPRREFLYSDDLVDASMFLMANYNGESAVNVGSKEEVSIKELAQLIAQAVGFQGTIQYDSSKPDGAKRKFLDSSKINRLGWKSKITLKQGIALAADTINKGAGV